MASLNLLLLSLLLPPSAALRATTSTLHAVQQQQTQHSRSRSPRCALAEERAESGKAAVLSAVAGSLVAAPLELIAPDMFGIAPAFSPQWEFATDGLALELFLFGVVYRYAVRSDSDNDMLKMGAAGAFIVMRTLSSAQVGSQCTALPLNCGAPLGYLDWSLIGQLAYLGIASALAFGGAAVALELAFDKGLVGRIPAGGLPTE